MLPSLRGIHDAYRRAFEGIPREVWFLAMVMLINRSGSMVLPFLSLYARQGLGFSAEASGMVVVAYGIGSSLGTFLGGVLTERIGAMRIQFYSLILNAVGFLALSRMQSYWSFGATLFVLSVVSDAFRPANGAALTSLCKPEVHSRAFALNRLAINLGFTVGPAVGGVLATFSYQWLFWVDAATCGLAALALRWMLPYPQTIAKPTSTVSLSNQRSPWFDRLFWIFMGLNVVTFTVFFQLLATYTLFLSEIYRLKEWHIGLLLATNTIIVVFCEMLLVHRLDGFSKLKSVAVGSFLMCEGFALLSLGHGFWWALFCVMIWTLGEMLAMPQAMAFVAQRGGESRRGSYLGAHATSISFAFIFAPILGSQCYGIDPNLFWYIAIPVGFAVLAGFWCLSLIHDSPGVQHG